MTNKNLSLLGIVAVIMLVLAVVVHKNVNKPVDVGFVRGNLIQGLNPENVFGIVIKAGGETANLKRVGGVFTVSDSDGYPAMNSKVNELFTSLMDIETEELLTDNPDNFEDLEVSEEKAQTIVRLTGKDGNGITGIVVGKRNEQGDANVRLVNSDKVFICSKIPYIPTQSRNFLDQQLIQIEKKNIVSVTMTDEGGETYTMQSQPGSDEITLAGGMPAGKKLHDNHTFVFNALAGLRFKNVMAEGSKPQNLTLNRTYITKLKDTATYILKLGDKDGKTYATVSADFGDKTAISARDVQGASEEQLKKNEAKLLAMEAVEKVNAKCKGWVFELPSYKVKYLTMSLDEILEDIEQGEPEE